MQQENEQSGFIHTISVIGALCATFIMYCITTSKNVLSLFKVVAFACHSIQPC